MSHGLPADDATRQSDGPPPPLASTSPRFVSGDVIGERYRIVAEIGRGGMGEVYRADDLRLAQTVALKFLPPSVASDRRMLDRLASEVRIGRQASHPNVCRLYDLVETGGVSFVAMEFIDGEDLGSLLRRIGRLPPDKGLALCADMCAGLAAAHDAGVVHRDLKPANVMIDGRGVARIMDFGLAVEGGAGGVAGTPAYMAPEQLAGRGASASSDVYALGLVLWEMLTGRRLFDGSSIDEIRRQHAAPKGRPSFFARDIDPGVEDLILRCLDENPARRPQSAREVLAALPRPEGAPSPPSGASRTPHRGTSPRERELASVAVLPFEQLGGGNDDSFAVGLAEEIIGDLAKLRKLRVIARGSVMRFKGAQECRPIARELRVRYVLTGSVRMAGGRLRVTANLVDGDDESLVWSEKFPGTRDDIFDIQERIARTIVKQLEVELSEEESARIGERPIADAQVYERYLRARQRIWSFREGELELAVEDLEVGLKQVGENPLLLSTLAVAWWQYFNSGLRPDESYLDKAERIAERIFAIEPDSVHGHRVLGMCALSRGNVREGLIRLRTAARHAAGDTEVLVWLAICCYLSGVPEVARPYARRLRELDPLGPDTPWVDLFDAWFSGRFDDAVEAARRRALSSVGEVQTTASLWYHLTLAKRTDEAALLADGLDRYRAVVTGLYRFLKLALDGDRAAALAYAPSLEWARKDLQFAMHVAEGWAMLGEKDRALEWLESAVDRGLLVVEWIAEHDWFLEGLRGEPRFRSLLERMRRERDELRAALA